MSDPHMKEVCKKLMQQYHRLMDGSTLCIPDKPTQICCVREHNRALMAMHQPTGGMDGINILWDAPKLIEELNKLADRNGTKTAVKNDTAKAAFWFAKRMSTLSDFEMT